MLSVTTFSGLRGPHFGLLLVGLLLGVGACGGEATKARPNVLLISVDSLRRDHVSAYGYQSPHAKGERTTPAVERLAAEGTLFADAVSTTSWTLPAHMALFTGLEDQLHGVTNNAKRLDPAITTLPQLFAARGYRTGGFFTGPNLHPIFGFGAGFELYENASGEVLPDEAFEKSAQDENALLAVHNQSHAGLTSPELNRRGLAWLDDAATREEPFFLFLHYWDPHYNYEPPAEYATRFDPDYTGTASGANFIYSRDVKTPRDMQHILALYDAEIRYTDDHIARVLERLDSLGLAEDTLVVFVSDHGDEFYEHGKKGHQRNFFDESVRVPLVMRWPGHVPAGLVVEPQVRIQDIMPTVAELADLAPASYVTGESLMPLLRGASQGPPAQVFDLELPRRNTHLSGLRESDRMVVWDHVAELGALYNLRTDPQQLHPTPFRDLATSTIAPIQLLRERLAELEAQRQDLPFTPGFGDLDQLPEALEADLRAQGYLGDGEPPSGSED